ncbi:hypothetical protein ACFRFL_42155 [Streptomyces sp. NPDC056708]|uniref:hypothetical protein n=1 Tax=unclassified Streptomyces TaxID=2593676 RepID=UPI00369A1B7F
MLQRGAATPVLGIPVRRETAGQGRNASVLRCADAALGRGSTGRVPSAHEGGEGAALFFLAGNLLVEDVAVDVGVDGGEDQALGSGGFHIGRSGYWNLRSS